uniref:glycine--tRNA ligase n=1 Tax=candidate division CPR3 bacterium TaxID=2268181 RepID=A0A7C5YXV0_UNCC3
MSTLDKISSLCKRRGFVIQSSDIYGGFANVYDFGPLGVALKNNIKRLWIKSVIEQRKDMYQIDGAIFMHPRAWEASGHTKVFTDPLIDCEKCKRRFRADQLEGWRLKKDNKTGKWTVLKQGSLTCPVCGGSLIPKVREFNLMMESYVGAVKDESTKAYLKPESCQNIYLNFMWVKDSMRAKIPFGIAQIGKAFRNELTSGQFIFRLREFEQMDIEYFVHPKEAERIYEEWKKERFYWYEKKLGIKKEHLRFRQHEKEELIFYAKDAWDIEYNFPFGWKELEGVHNRGDYDLKQHSKFSGKKLTYFDSERNEEYTPYIIECSGGVERTFLVLMFEFYSEEEVEDVNGKKYIRVVLRFPKEIAPVKYAVFPLLRSERLVEEAKKIYEEIRKIEPACVYDEVGSIGRRYRRQDEIGTPVCLTIDHQTLEDGTFTIRDRDTMKQERISLDSLLSRL